MLLGKQYDGTLWQVKPSRGCDRDDLDWAIIRVIAEDEEGEEERDTLAFVVTETSAESLRDSLAESSPEAEWFVLDRNEGSWDDMDWAVVRTNEDGTEEPLAFMQTEYLAEKFLKQRTGA
jgi:hypothetical protein